MKPNVLLLLCCGLMALAACDDRKAAAPPPPPEITVVRTMSQKVPIYKEFVGQTYGFKDIAIRARVEGFLEGIHFQEGSRVNAGDLLYTLESQPYEEAVAAKMSMVAEAQTMLAKARRDLGRIRPLAASRAVSQSDLDGAVALHDAAIAEVEAAQANLRASRIQLGYTRILSPINGIIGKTQAKVGDFVGRSPNPVILDVVSQIDPILVRFFITESQYLQTVRRVGRELTADESKAPKQDLNLILIDGSVYEHTGRFDFIGREVDPATGGILLQASFPNPDSMLRPGQFAKVKVQTEVIPDGILVPQRCVVELQGIHSVFVVSSDNTVQRREIQAGPKVGAFWLVSKGLQPGELVVYEGLQRIREGAVVKPVEKTISSTTGESG